MALTKEHKQKMARWMRRVGRSSSLMYTRVVPPSEKAKEDFKRKPYECRTYKYGMRLRGFAPGAQPMDGLIMSEDGADHVEEYGRLYHNILTYRRRLTSEELDQYELDEL